MDSDLCTLLSMFPLYLSLTLTCLLFAGFLDLLAIFLAYLFHLAFDNSQYLSPHLSLTLPIQYGMIKSSSPNNHPFLCSKV